MFIVNVQKKSQTTRMSLIFNIFFIVLCVYDNPCNILFQKKKLTLTPG